MYAQQQRSTRRGDAAPRRSALCAVAAGFLGKASLDSAICH
jgi:hypothetical protein